MNSELKPKIRFKGFTDDWEQRKFNEYINLRMGHLFSPSDYVKDGKYNVITISNVKGDRYIDISDVNTVDSLPSNINNYQILYEDDLLISLTGNIGRVSYNKGANNILNYRVGKIEFGKKEIYDKFIYAYLCQDSIIRGFIDKGQGGAQPNISKPEVENLSIIVPSIDEQIKIGRFFEILDNTITLHQRKCNKLIELKKSLMEKMFPQNNSVIPEIRFKGFTDDWEQRKLANEVTDLIAGGDIDKNNSIEKGKYPIYANALVNDGIVGFYNNYFRVKAPAVTVTGRGEIGHAVARDLDFTPVVRLLSLKSNHYNHFLAKAINNLNVVSESTGVPQLTVPQLEKYEIKFPKTLEEEKQIGNIFVQIDNLITLHQRKHYKLNKIKQSLLNDMFV